MNMEYISRHLEGKILELSKSYSAILLTDPRQASKSTILRSIDEKENMYICDQENSNSENSSS